MHTYTHLSGKWISISKNRTIYMGMITRATRGGTIHLSRWLRKDHGNWVESNSLPKEFDILILNANDEEELIFCSELGNGKIPLNS
ncbi:MAG: hypothetical protein ISS93_03115 [Candidatus Aenigmarchaeota archaeon]|nr:hypothetical protein [Candidatus Aenigmarchaeota archaeon]